MNLHKPIKGIMAIIIAVASSTFPLKSTNPKEDPFEFGHHRVALDGAITSSSTYILEASYHYMINQHVGIGAGIGLNQSYSADAHPSGNNWEIDSDTSRPGNMYLHLSALFKTPSLIFKSISWGLMAEPGVALQVPYARCYVEDLEHLQVTNRHLLSTNKGQVFSADARIGIYANFNRIGISAGYILTTFDINSYYRNFSYRGVSFDKFYPHRPVSHGAFLTLSYYLQ